MTLRSSMSFSWTWNYQNRVTSIMPLLYQSGYITIKGYDPDTELYLLDISNKEIRVGLYRCLLPNYIGMNTVKGTTTIARQYNRSLLAV